MWFKNNEDLDVANSSEHSAWISSNLSRQKDQTYFQTKSSCFNKIPARHPIRNRREMGILQKGALRTSNSFDVLTNFKDAPDYQSKMKRYLHHDSGIIHPNYNSNKHTWNTISVIVSGDVQTKYSINVKKWKCV